MTTAHSTDRWDVIRRIYDERPEGTTIGIAIRDLHTGDRLDINGEEDFASASTIKLLIQVGLARAFDEGRLLPDDTRPAPQSMRLEGSGVVNWLDPNIELTLRDHAWLMIAISDNTTSNVCIDAVGIDAINAAGEEIGVGATRLGRMFMGSNAPAGPPKNRATANGLVAILAAIEEDRAASPAQCAWIRSCLSDQQHVTRLARYLPDGVSYRGKTGTINLIAHDCGVLCGSKGDLAIAVLTHGFEDQYEADAYIGRIGTAAAEMIA